MVECTTTRPQATFPYNASECFLFFLEYLSSQMILVTLMTLSLGFPAWKLSFISRRVTPRSGRPNQHKPSAQQAGATIEVRLQGKYARNVTSPELVMQVFCHFYHWTLQGVSD